MRMHESQNTSHGAKRAIATSVGPEFEKFLYAPIFEANDEVSLSVLSALARKNLDPWVEAAALAHLSKDSAIATLTSVIEAATSNCPSPMDLAANSARLVALLPQGNFIGGRNQAAFFRLRANSQDRFVRSLIALAIIGHTRF
jgi:hypothetical protein